MEAVHKAWNYLISLAICCSIGTNLSYAAARKDNYQSSPYYFVETVHYTELCRKAKPGSKLKPMDIRIDYSKLPKSQWKMIRSGVIPENAAIIDCYRRKPVYACQINYQGRILTGRVMAGDACYVEVNGQRFGVYDYYVMLYE
jgi:hypothetical protein